jgi:hypothetical protein
MACNNDIEFTRIIVGKSWGLQPSNISWYRERVLIKNIPQNDTKQSKIMIAYFDSVGPSGNYFSEIPEIKHYLMSFYKSTRATREYFIEKKNVSTYNGNETDLGSVYMGRCKNDPTKWKVIIARNFETTEDYDYLGVNTKDEFLQNECDPDWYEANKNNELVKYYMELREKRKKVGNIRENF